MRSAISDRSIRRKLRGCLFRLAAAGLAAILLSAVLELGLRLLPVNRGLAAQAVTTDDPILHFRPNRDSYYSHGWRMTLANPIHTNNAGYVSDLDYSSEAPHPLLAIVGDSYIEAAMVPWESTAAGRLAREVEGTGAVYSFGVSGAPLSQYLAQVGDIRARYGADGYVVLVVGNDFDESLAQYKQDPGFHYFREQPDGSLSLELQPLQIGTARHLVRRSRLGMYLVANLKILNVRSQLAARGSGSDSWVGNTVAAAEQQRVEDSRRAVDTFLARLPAAAGVTPERVLIVVDGIRPQLYEDRQLEKASSSYFALMRRYLLERGSSAGFEMLDMQPRFVQRFRRTAERFEFEEDAHWNDAGHDEFANAIRESHLWQALIVENGR
ncbi:MAG: hypothetical protein OEV00_12710 [Acidobacteriota bacterium]|nr:hypothetical protein [Acidobacteriota bacterium]MDH3786173.1 hypothetical protein [Acidobacteriota bacterium]